MKIPAVKNLAENYDLAALEQAEADLTEERPLQIEAEGADEGEKLTHIMAAIWVKKHVAEKNVDLRTALRDFSQRVRDSIS